MSLVEEREASTRLEVPPLTSPVRAATPLWAFVALVCGGLLLLGVASGLAYLGAIAALAVVLFIGVYSFANKRQQVALIHRAVDRRDLFVIAVVYVLVVMLYRLAFVVTEGNDLLLFVFFASGLVSGVGAPVIYTVWYRRRSLATLGLSLNNLPRVATLALIFAVVQSSPLWGYELPDTRSWATLLGMSLMIGLFEAIFFRGFIQGRLEASFGAAPAVFGGALFYGLYHVGYGMGLEEALFLAGLGIVYALAYLTAENVLVLWPLMTPLGAWFSQLESGELFGRLPWASLLGFADVVGIMAAILWIARRHERKLDRAPV